MDSDQLQKVFPDTKSCRSISLHMLPFAGSVQFHPKQKLRNFVEQLQHGGFEVHYYENDDFYVTEFLWADEPTTKMLCEFVAETGKSDLHFHFSPLTNRFEIFIERYEPTYSTLNDEELDY